MWGTQHHLSVDWHSRTFVFSLGKCICCECACMHVHTIIIVLKSHSYAFNTICTNLVTFIIILILPMTYYYIYRTTTIVQLTRTTTKPRGTPTIRPGASHSQHHVHFPVVHHSDRSWHRSKQNYSPWLRLQLLPLLTQRAWKLNTYKECNYALHACMLIDTNIHLYIIIVIIPV